MSNCAATSLFFFLEVQSKTLKSLLKKATDTFASAKLKFYLTFRVLGTVESRVLSDSARLDLLPSAGTSLLDYKRGVPVARPHGG
jgi:hypothetical protein